MQLDWDDHFREIVVPAWQSYRASERRLSEAAASKDPLIIDSARYETLREGGAACFYLHHFADIVLRAGPDWLPQNVTKIQPLLDWVAKDCTYLRSDKLCDDVNLLRDVAESLKHAILTRYLHERQVSGNEAVLVAGTGYGELPYGEGKYGGTLQTVILTTKGPRALSAVLQNVVDAWRRVSDQDLPEIGKP